MAEMNHYDVLGLTPQASASDLKRRFRELARVWHPDVAQDANAAERFKTINEAYRVLSNPATRARYDADLQLAAARAAAGSRAGRPVASGQSRAKAKPTPTSPTGARRKAEQGRPRSDTADYSYVVARLLRDAQLALSRMRLHEAAECCRAVLNLDRRNGSAHEVLGDICGIRGQVEAALAHYTIALQLDPHNLRLRTKFERVAAEDQGRSGRTRGGGGSAANVAARQAAAMMLGLILIGAMVALVASSSSSMFGEPWAPWDWTPLAVFGLPAAGVIAGFTGAQSGLLGPARREMLTTTSAPSGRSVVPMGVILVVLSLVCFWLAGLLYVAVAAIQEALSRSVIAAFVTCGGIVGVFAAVMPEASLPVFLLGGNLVFPAFVCGWVLGDGTRD